MLTLEQAAERLVEMDETQEVLQILDSSGSQPFLDRFDFALIHENDIAKEQAPSNMELRQ